MGGSTPEETDALIDEALRRGDAAGAAALFEEDAVFVVSGSGDAVAGRDAIRETFQELIAEGVPEFESSVRAVFVAGDIALVLSDWRTVSTGEGPLPDEGCDPVRP